MRTLNSFMMDAQQVLSFLTQQATSIETEVYRIVYPDIQYPQLIPVDTSANEWAKSITFFSMEKVGAADWLNHMAKDVPLADIARSKYEQGIEMAGIGYRYTLEELGSAMLIPGLNLTSERAEAARRAYEEFLDQVGLYGDTTKGWTGLVNDANVTIIAATANGALNGETVSTEWEDKTADQIMNDFNNAITAAYTASKTVELADTVLLPVAEHARIAQMPRSTGSDMTVLDWLQKYNVYTAQTNQPLTVRAVRGLETAGAGGVGRMVVYRRDPQVLKFHIPMPHRFLPVWQTGPMVFDVPGIFRTGGVEIRRPGAVRYVDGIIDATFD
jgi:hypothetical protein